MSRWLLCWGGGVKEVDSIDYIEKKKKVLSWFVYVHDFLTTNFKVLYVQMVKSFFNVWVSLDFFLGGGGGGEGDSIDHIEKMWLS